ncbi:MAG: hypothetical protein IKD68_09220 [Solobacterium sp.]|nr:hypothetical protein [Solobacterium sp.]
MEKIYRERLSLEAMLKNPNVYMDMDSDEEKAIKKQIRSLKKSCEEAEYSKWTKEYIDAELKKIEYPVITPTKRIFPFPFHFIC